MRQVVKLAREIIEMQEEIDFLRHENAMLQGYREKYDQLLQSGIAHNQAMIGNLFTLGMELAGTGYFDKKEKSDGTQVVSG